VKIWIIIGITMNMLKMPMYTPTRSCGMLPASITYGLPMMLPHASPTPIIGTNSSARSWIDGIQSIASPASVRQKACTIFGPSRRVNGTIANAARNATKL
jgi:hypothetical protein